MRIAQIAPLIESVPPRLYGGTERIVSYLTEELVRLGHEVTLFASGDSVSGAALVAGCGRALRLLPAAVDPLPYNLMMLDEVRRRADEFDVVHAHIDLLQYVVLREYRERCITTLHGRLDLPIIQRFYDQLGDFPLVSISNHQRIPMPDAPWAGTVYHGLPLDLLPFNPAPSGGYLAFLGRISPEKRPDRAIDIAERAGLPLKIAAKIDRQDQVYWEELIEPLIRRSPHVEYIGEISEHEKPAFLGEAQALLFPIDWPEPFGLVMIEAMSCGTPVIAFDRGSVHEVLKPGVSGFVVNSVDEAVQRVDEIGLLDRKRVRGEFERRFSVERMARDYEAIYRTLTPQGRLKPRLPLASRSHNVIV